MADWGGAFSAAMKAGSGLIDLEMQKQEKIEAEQRAADRQVSIEERLLAVREMAKNRAAERFAAMARGKMAEQVPVTADPVTRTTSEGARAAGLKDGLINMTREQVMAYKYPDMLKQFDAQLAADNRLAQEKAAGQTRPRTREEAIQAALDESMLNDPSAFVAGKAMFKDEETTKLEERKLEQKEKLERMRLEQKDRSDDKRFEAMMARIEAAAGGKAGGDKTALIQNAEYLKSLGYSDDKIEKFIFEKKELPLEDVAAKILASDRTEEMTPEQAAQKATAIRDALNSASSKPKGETSKAGAPFSEGTRLRGKDGQIYVVKGGQPVLESQASRTSGGLINR